MLSLIRFFDFFVRLLSCSDCLVLFVFHFWTVLTVFYFLYFNFQLFWLSCIFCIPLLSCSDCFVFFDSILELFWLSCIFIFFILLIARHWEFLQLVTVYMDHLVVPYVNIDIYLITLYYRFTSWWMYSFVRLFSA